MNTTKEESKLPIVLYHFSPLLCVLLGLALMFFADGQDKAFGFLLVGLGLGVAMGRG